MSLAIIGIIYTSSWMAAVKVDKDTKTVEVMPHVNITDPWYLIFDIFFMHIYLLT